MLLKFILLVMVMTTMVRRHIFDILAGNERRLKFLSAQVRKILAEKTFLVIESRNSRDEKQKLKFRTNFLIKLKPKYKT